MEKPTINVVIVGHANAGKSTTVGHLIQECGGVDIQAIERCECEAEEMGKGSLNYAWVFDQRTAERERGITMDSTLRRLESRKYHFNIIDTPGHRDFVENMITGTSQADVALLIVDSSKEGYEIGIDENGQTREHALLAYALGVKQMIVVINKMDDETINFSEDRWKTIRSEVATYLKKVGYKPMKIPFIPVSGWLGDNLKSKSIHMPWYGGPTLLEALDNVSVPKRQIDKPLRVPIQDVQNIEGTGAVLVGRVETGVLRPGMKVQFAPSGSIDTVETLQINFQTVPQAIAGDIVCINIHDKLNVSKDLRPGHVLSDYDSPARGVVRFEAQIIIMNHPGEISIGYTPTIDIHTSHTPCTFVDIKEKMDRRTGRILEKNPKSVKAGDACIVELEPKRPLSVETFKSFPPLGRFAVRDFGQTVAVGVVKSVIYGNGEE